MNKNLNKTVNSINNIKDYEKINNDKEVFLTSFDCYAYVYEIVSNKIKKLNKEKLEDLDIFLDKYFN